MRLLDVFRIMNEAPIRDFDVQPSATTPDTNTWSDRDKRKLSSPAFEKLARKKIKTGIPIDVTIIGISQDDADDADFLDEPSNWMSGNVMGRKFIDMLDDYSGVVDSERFEHLTGIHMIPTEDAITAVFLSNTNDASSAMPVSPWILCHRLSHSIFDAASKLHLGEKARQNAYPFINVPLEWLTMNSAKPGKRMANTGETGVELMAQFLHDGKITLARVEGMVSPTQARLTNGHTVYAEPDDKKLRSIPDNQVMSGNDVTDPLEADEMNWEIEDLESQLNISAGIIVDAALGMLVVAP